MAAACLLGIAALASADQLSWTFQAIDRQPVQTSPHLGLGMRTGSTWPVAFYWGSGSGELYDQMVGTTLTPVGWQRRGLGQSPGYPTIVRSATGNDGRVGAAWLRDDGISFAQFTNTGWHSSSFTTQVNPDPRLAPDLSYLGDDTPIVAHARSDRRLSVHAYNGGAWETELVDTYESEFREGEYVSVDVDSFDRIGLASWNNGDVNFAFKDDLAGDWQGARVTSEPSNVQSLSLAFGPNDEPAIAILSDYDLSVATYDIQSNEWVVEEVAQGIESERVQIAFDNLGHMALAYMTQGQQDDELHYRIQRDAGWADYTLPNGLDPDSDLYVSPTNNTEAALAFDANNLPVIAYYGHDGLLLAYDPIIPEPTTALLLIVGVAAMRRR